MKKISVIAFIILTLTGAAFAQKNKTSRTDPAKDVRASFRPPRRGHQTSRRGQSDERL